MTKLGRLVSNKLYDVDRKQIAKYGNHKFHQTNFNTRIPKYCPVLTALETLTLYHI